MKLGNCKREKNLCRTLAKYRTCDTLRDHNVYPRTKNRTGETVRYLRVVQLTRGVVCRLFQGNSGVHRLGVGGIHVLLKQLTIYSIYKTICNSTLVIFMPERRLIFPAKCIKMNRN